MTPEVVAIVVHYGSAAVTRRCVDSLAASRHHGAVSVIVVDNGSPEPFTAVAGPLPVSCLHLPANRGYAGAINAAMDELARTPASDDRAVLLLNNDVTLDPGCLAALGARASESVLLAPVIYDRPGGTATDWGERLNGFTGFHRPLRTQPSGDTVVEFVTGAILFARERVLRAIGPWDERYFMYGEDTDYCLRAARRGIAITIVPSAVACHPKGTASGGGLNPSTAYCIHRNRVLLARRWLSRPFYAAFVSYYGAAVAAKWMRAGDQAVRRAMIAGFADGVRGREGAPGACDGSTSPV